MQIDKQTSVRDVVVTYPQTRRVLESLGIDYCCGGSRELAAAAALAGVSADEALAAVRDAASRPLASTGPSERSWAEASLTEMVDHIESTHHDYMKQTLPRLDGLFAKVIAAHGAHHGEMLGALRQTFAGLREEIEMHLMKEEQVLFPYIREMESSVSRTGAVPQMHCGTIRNPIGQMEHEHDNAGAALAEMRRLTGDYSLPADACPTFAALFETLQEMEADLHQHIHLENNILFPRATAMEAGGE